MLKQRDPVRIGDIIELHTPRGNAYLQYTHRRKPYGSLIRVLPGFYKSRPTDFRNLAKQKELYFAFCPVDVLVRQKILEVVANIDIPDHARNFPKMRKRGFVRPISKGGGVSHWIILDDEDQFRVETLTPEQQHLSIASSWNLGMLVKRVTEEWRPELDDGSEKASKWLPSSGNKAVTRHFLYFSSEEAARRAEHTIARAKWKVEIRRAAQGPKWLLLITVSSDEDTQALRTELEQFALKFEAEYDGWEVDLRRKRAE